VSERASKQLSAVVLWSSLDTNPPHIVSAADATLRAISRDHDTAIGTVTR